MDSTTNKEQNNNSKMIAITVVFLLAVFGAILAVPIMQKLESASGRREAVEKYFQDMAKYGCKIESIQFEGNRFSGRISMQNGFGAWTTADFHGSIYKIGDGWSVSGSVPRIEERDSKIKAAADEAVQKLKEAERDLRGY